MVSQVIVPVAGRNIEGDSAKELLKICRNESPGPSMVQELCDFEASNLKEGRVARLSSSKIGGPCRDRTYDQLIKSQLLYQLS